MVGFGLYGSIHGPSEYDVTIQVAFHKNFMQAEVEPFLVDPHGVWTTARLQ